MISSVGTVIPSTAFTLAMLTDNSRGSTLFPVFTSTCKAPTLPQFNSSIKWQARFKAITVEYSSTPFA